MIEHPNQKCNLQNLRDVEFRANTSVCIPVCETQLYVSCLPLSINTNIRKRKGEKTNKRQRKTTLPTIWLNISTSSVPLKQDDSSYQKLSDCVRWQ